MHNTNTQIKLNLNVKDRFTWLKRYSNAFILVSGTATITVEGNYDAMRWLDERNKGVIFKNWSRFTNCLSKINNTQIDNAKYIDVVLMYNLIEYSDNFSKTSGSLSQYYRDDPNDPITPSGSFKYKIGIIGKPLPMEIHRTLK